MAHSTQYFIIFFSFYFNKFKKKHIFFFFELWLELSCSFVSKISEAETKQVHIGFSINMVYTFFWIYSWKSYCFYSFAPGLDIYIWKNWIMCKKIDTYKKIFYTWKFLWFSLYIAFFYFFHNTIQFIFILFNMLKKHVLSPVYIIVLYILSL